MSIYEPSVAYVAYPQQPRPPSQRRQILCRRGRPSSAAAVTTFTALALCMWSWHACSADAVETRARQVVTCPAHRPVHRTRSSGEDCAPDIDSHADTPRCCSRPGEVSGISLPRYLYEPVATGCYPPADDGP